MEALKFVKVEDSVERPAIQNGRSLQLDALCGIWLNTDSASQGIVKLVIKAGDTKLAVRVFGQRHSVCRQDAWRRRSFQYFAYARGNCAACIGGVSDEPVPGGRAQKGAYGKCKSPNRWNSIQRGKDSAAVGNSFPECHGRFEALEN
jgi:hypothetical protein